MASTGPATPASAPGRASTARLERAALAAALLSADPDAPTLCEGWSALDLAAHVAVRERRPDSLPGLGVPALAAHTERLRRRATALGMPELVRRLRTGPPAWSPFAVPGVDSRLNLFEYVIHHEDLRRGDGSGPRTGEDEPARLQDDVWAALPGATRLVGGLRGGLVARWPGSGEQVLRRGGDPAVLVGPPVEVALYLFGRRSAARVEVEGSVVARERLAAATLRA